MSMRLLLATTGSAGDVLPFFALARGLAERGHQVTLLAPREFGQQAGRLQIPFAALEPEGAPRPARRLGGLLRPLTRRWRKLARASTIVPLLRPTYEAIARRYVSGRTAVVASGPLLGARVAHDRLGVPLATVHFSPAPLRSACRPPLQPPACLPAWLPARAKRAAY